MIGVVEGKLTDENSARGKVCKMSAGGERKGTDNMIFIHEIT